jgi:hydrogenase nickel incorporation protein HypA/HybF
MHELSLCIAIAELVQDGARREGVARVSRVVLALGTAAPVDPEALRFSFPLVAAGTVLDGAELVIQRVPLRLRCTACAQVFDPATQAEPCPACGGIARETLQGREMRVLSFDGE